MRDDEWISCVTLLLTLSVTDNYSYYAPPLGSGTLSDDARLTSVCLSVAYIGLSREQRGLGRLTLAQR